MRSNLVYLFPFRLLLVCTFRVGAEMSAFYPVVCVIQVVALHGISYHCYLPPTPQTIFLTTTQQGVLPTS